MALDFDFYSLGHFIPQGGVLHLRSVIASNVVDKVSQCGAKKIYVNSKKKITELKEALDTALSALISDDDMISTLNQQLMTAYRAEKEY